MNKFFPNILRCLIRLNNFSDVIVFQSTRGKYNLYKLSFNHKIMHLFLYLSNIFALLISDLYEYFISNDMKNMRTFFPCTK